jgi:hypothetical protein
MVQFLESILKKSSKKTDLKKPNIKYIAPKNRKVERVFIHCSDSDLVTHDDISVIRTWHTSASSNDPSKPWNDIGYHYFISKESGLQIGRWIELNPAAQLGHNDKTIAICLAGQKYFTINQFEILRELCKQIKKAHENVTFHGHCEVDNFRTCPNFNYKQILNLDANGNL